MIRNIKPKTARGKRALKEREPKVIENVKTALFLKANKASSLLNALIKDFALLKKPDAIILNKKNDLHVFEDEMPLDFLCTKNDSSLFMIASHSKKRPHTLTVGRTFDGHVLDMIELNISNHKGLAEFQSKGCGVGKKPVMVFAGDKFETCSDLQLMKSLFLDFFHGQELTEIALNGIEHVISLTAVSESEILFRVYSVELKNSGVRTPRVELVDMGHFCDMKVSRVKHHSPEMFREAMKMPRVVKENKVKNVSKDEAGDKFGRIHLGRQDLSGLQSRKFKGLKGNNNNTRSDGQ